MTVNASMLTIHCSIYVTFWCIFQCDVLTEEQISGMCCIQCLYRATRASIVYCIILSVMGSLTALVRVSLIVHAYKYQPLYNCIYLHVSIYRNV